MSVKVKINGDALTALTRGVIEEKTAEIAARAGEGFVGDVILTDRPHGAVRAETYEARLRNARDNVLLKAVLG